MRTIPITVVETPTFANKAGGFLDSHERDDLIGFLARNPESGAIIQGTGGVRKVRWAREGQGKSGGYRVIYYYYNPKWPLFALTIYPKSMKNNLTQGERAELKLLVHLLVAEYGKKKNESHREK